MTKNSRFTVAVHALALLSIVRGKPATSDYIARSVNTNPVVIRRILGVLGKAGLVETHPGAFRTGQGSGQDHPARDLPPDGQCRPLSHAYPAPQ